MPKMSFLVIAVRLPFGVGCERGRFFLRVDVSMAGLEARNTDVVNVCPLRSLRRPATQCDTMFTGSHFITCRGRPGSVAPCRGPRTQRQVWDAHTRTQSFPCESARRDRTAGRVKGRKIGPRSSRGFTFEMKKPLPRPRA